MGSDPSRAGIEQIPGRVVRWYAVVAGSWIVLSDLFVALLDGVPVDDRIPDLAKGLAFVAVSASALWLVLRRLHAAHDRAFATTVTAQRNLYRSVLDTTSDVVVIVDEGGRVRYANRAAEEVLGWSPTTVLGVLGASFVHPDDLASALGFIENARTCGRATRSARTFNLRHADSSYRAMDVTCAPIALETGTGVVISARDVTERVRSEQQLRAALAEDVTGLPNLRAFTAEMAVLDEVRADRAAVTVVMVDIDRFSDINALHGRGAGDRVLREVGRRIDAALPQAVGVWHPGVDRFLAVVFEQGSDVPAELTRPAELGDRVRQEVSAPISLDGAASARVSVRLAIGLAQVALEGSSGRGPLGERLLAAAEAALTEAKRHPDRIALHRWDEGTGTADRAQLVADLHDALTSDQLVVRYQPKVRLTDGVIVGAEALVRWEHPVRGLLEPGEFLPLVSAANLSGPVTDVVLRKSLDQVGRWLAVGCDHDFTVSVNVSLDDLRRTNFVDEVFAALERSTVAPGRLTLEVTEQTMLADPAGVQAAIDRLRAAGVSIAIDDFGTGFSALEHIRMFAVDELKIDKSFVQQLTRNSADEAIVDSIVAIGARLGVLVTAEGIEDESAASYLRAAGCALGQGYLFSRPVTADDFDPRATFPVGE